jgi:Domain of unknown function (DUF5060)/Putative collagen-binding domain of a collagenase
MQQAILFVSFPNFLPPFTTSVSKTRFLFHTDPSLMKRLTSTSMTFAMLSIGLSALANELTSPIVTPDLVFDEVDGIVAVETEHFYKQTITDKRAWYINSSKSLADIKPDSDPAHVAGASGGAYLEALPDTRANHGEKLISGENFTDKAGLLAVLSYKIHIKTPGRYYVWVRSFSSGSEDNGVHVGLDGQWPASGQRWQTVKKQDWAWECKQRTPEVHTGVPMQLFLDIEKAGEHEIMFSMREDGFEMDKFILAMSKDFKPEGKGPTVKVKSGKLPESFPEIAALPKAAKNFPAHWGEPPAVQTQDIRPLPGGYGEGSSTLANWIQNNLDKAVEIKKRSPSLTAKDFIDKSQGYYLDKGKWLAINPEKNKEANAHTSFPYPTGKYDVTLHTVGESDGKSRFQLTVGDNNLGDFTAPLSTETYEEGPQFTMTWKNVAIANDVRVYVSSQIASSDGKEWSRARIAEVSFAPADEATKATVAKLLTTSPAKPVESLLAQPRQPDGKGEVSISGEVKQWHKVTLTLDGPFAHERDTDPNAFTDLAFNVQLTHESGSPSYRVPGYFAADGNAGNSSAESGTKWRVHVSPDKAGTWKYTVSFTRGKNAALDGGGVSLKPFDGLNGSFKVAVTDKSGRDFRAHGRLQYVGKHHLQFAGSKEYFFKAGTDSPETMMAYVDFDNTMAGKREKSPLKTFDPHVADWKALDPTWRDGKGKGIIGALNYLAAKGVNSFSFLTYNAAGDGDNIWPFAERNAKLNYDCSKLDQWGMVFDHATARGLHLHFKLQENELDDNRLGPDRKEVNLPESLDNGKLGIERKLYCRELIARFGHALALNWNIGEENTQSTEEIRDMVKYLHDTDPYHHNVVIHTFPPQQDLVYKPLLGNKSLLSGVSLQNSWNKVHQLTLHWIRESSAAGRPWVVANDEQNPAGLGVPPDAGYKGHNGIAQEKDPKGSKAEGNFAAKPYTMHDIRKLTLWGNLMAGGAGVEYYFGYSLPENDLNLQDFRSRDKSWDYCRIALDFFRTEKIPFAEMTSSNALVGNKKDDNSKYCFAKTGELYLVYLPAGGTTALDLSSATGNFNVKWFNPRAGGELVTGSVKAVNAGESVSLGNPPADATEDWLVVIRR